MNSMSITGASGSSKLGWAVVTGASSGIGRAFAVELAKRGHPVLLVARRKDALTRVAAEIASAGGRAEVLVADLAAAEGVELTSRTAAALDIDVLVNNAGVGSYGRFADRPVGDETAQVMLNIGAVVGLTRRLIPQMIARGHGQVINVASILAFMPTPFFATYAATKAFVLHFSEALAHELRETGVRVLASCPGVVATEFASVAGAEAEEGALPQLTPEAVARVTLDAASAGRVVRVIGLIYRLLQFLVAVTPRAFMPRIMGKVFAPRTEEAALTKQRAATGSSVSTELTEVRADQRKMLLAVFAWFAAALLGGAFNIFDSPGKLPIGIGLFIVVPIAAFIGVYRVSPRVRRALDLTPLWLLTLAHIWRFVGIGFVLSAIGGTLPKQFGYPEGIGDIIAATAAIPLAMLLYRRPDATHLRPYYLAWNIFGLIDLVSAITLGILYSPSTFGILHETVSTRPLTQIPASFIPAFFVPLFILTHLLGIRRSFQLSAGTHDTAAEPQLHANLVSTLETR